MKSIVFFILLSITLAGRAQTYSGPESVVYDAIGKRYFISNTTSHQVLTRDSTGTLSIFSSAFSSGPHGLEIVGNTLYACSGGFMKGFDLTDTSMVMNLNLGATFLNGICSDGVNYIYTTDFTAKKIFKVNIAAQTFTTFCSGLAKSPNGIIYDGANQRIVWVTWNANAPIMQAQLSDSSVSQVTATTLGSCDGIVRDGMGRYYISAWTTQSIYRFDSAFSTAPVAVVTGLNNPADIYYNLTNDSLVCPNANNNTVTFHYMGPLTSVKESSFSSFSVYPNPASDQLTIENGKLKIKKIEVYNTAGQKCLSSVLSTVAEPSSSLNISELAKGIYYV